MDLQLGGRRILTCILIFHAYVETAKVDIHPKNPLIATNGSLVINCTLIRNAHEDTVDEPYFVFNGSLSLINIGFQVEKLNFSAVQLTISEAQRNMSGLIECRHNMSSDSTFLTVADKPKKPTVKCRVYNWSNMTCFWDAQNENGIPTNISLLFNREHTLETELFNCPYYDLYKENSCSWLENDRPKPKDSLMPVAHHWIVLLAENQLGSVYTTLSFYPSDYVQPASISDLTCNEVGSQSCSLAWTSPRGEKRLFYRVRYTSNWNKSILIERNVTSVERNVKLQLKDLIPNTNYQIAVDCIPFKTRSGYWSEPKAFAFLTSVDVPALAPPVTPGGYHVLKQGQTGAQIQLFWQPLSKRWSNGKITGYRIKISRNTQFLTSNLRQTSVKSSVTSETFEIDETVSYWATVEASTSAGFNESLIPQKIIIPDRKSASLHPDKYFVTTSSHESNHFNFNWSTVPMATGYTIYWCNRGRNQPKNHYEWEIIDSSHTTHHLHLPNRTCDNVRFEISVESMLPTGETVSSGMKPFDAIYFTDGEIKMPEELKFSDDFGLSYSQTVVWNVPDDGVYCQNSAYISHFIIRYCNTITCHETIVDGSARSTTLTAGATYSIQIKSCSFYRESDFTAAVNVSTPSVNTLKSVNDSQETTNTIIVIICLCVAFALLIIMLLCCYFYKTSKNTIKIVIPKKLSFSTVEINDNSSAGYASQLLPDSPSGTEGCFSISDIHSICSSWNSDQINFSRHDYTNVSQITMDGKKFLNTSHACITENHFVSNSTSNSSPNLSFYNRVMMK